MAVTGNGWPAASADPLGPIARDHEAENKVEGEGEQRLKARAEEFVHRFVGLCEVDARVLAGELDLPIRFVVPGEGVMEDYCAGRVTAQLVDGVVVVANSE